VDGTASKEINMNTVTFSVFKTNMENTIQSIFETHQPVVVKKNRHSSVVVMPLEDYQALTETKYLLNSPANAARLVRGIEEIEDLIARGGK
jgi:antitoxin YefM